MKAAYLREQERYTQSTLSALLDATSNDIIQIIRLLKEYGIVKAVKATDYQKEMSDLLDEDVEITDVVANDLEHYYVFTFVGVISVAGRILICYPKYISRSKEPIEEMRQIIKVLEKYKSKEQIVRMFNDSSDEKPFNLLAVLLFLLQDYHENGSYNNTDDIVECNGTGEILWDKTINDSFAIISNRRPFYPELFTRKRVTDDHAFFKRLHDCVVTRASKELYESHLLDLFELTGVDLSDEDLESFGDNDYILYRIENELATQFNTRKQLVLKTLFAYIAHNSHIYDIDCFSLFGTNSFNLVWQDICQEILNNKLHTRLIDLDIKLDSQYTTEEYNSGNAKLIDIIDKPFWSITNQKATGTLIPDLITLDEKCFIIFDAKYYTPKLIPGHVPQGQPGIESITKQYLYQLAYKDFICAHHFESIFNCFIIPTEDPQADVFKGHVEMSFLRKSEFKLENIQVRLLPVRDAYSKYLRGERYPLSSLKLSQKDPSVRTIN